MNFNSLKRWRLRALSVGVLALTSCVLVNRFYDMEVLINGTDVAFTLPASDFADKEIRFVLNGIEVSRNPCDKACGGWEMSRPAHRTVTLTEDNFVKFPIKYGVTLPNMETRAYEPLRKGRYAAMAGFTLVKDGKAIGSKKVAAGFTIE